MTFLNRITEHGVVLKNRLPPGMRNFLVDAFFCYIPLSVLRILWKELAGYTKYKVPARGEVVVDAGAWTGHFTLVAARMVGPTGRVLSVEPQKAMSERLKARAKRLGFENISVVNAALFGHQGAAKAVTTNSSGFNVFDEVKETSRSEDINLRTLDAILAEQGIKKIHFVKMDIEGAELEALVGARETIDAMHPHFAIASYHVREGATTSGRLEEILKKHGYESLTGHPSHLTTWGWYANGAGKAA